MSCTLRQGLASRSAPASSVIAVMWVSSIMHLPHSTSSWYSHSWHLELFKCDTLLSSCVLYTFHINATMANINLPKNAHVSSHPCLQAKLSQLRSVKTGSKDAQTLVHEIALMVGYEALGAGLKAQQDGTVCIARSTCTCLANSATVHHT